ncbi:hypothetical protein PPACK8108_LOCUS26454 [Phakopsora pachyrhizi]|uniref:Uncharacterized protein n=1 Tax=Phakopsora pachyrhizi TaxID=170000 RepID=A0AAV0BZB5_PHAPC|nr:hypothetical protein PPACK8108_LOCUS26454 [Phakopsora pachyrhizi]
MDLAEELLKNLGRDSDLKDDTSKINHDGFKLPSLPASTALKQKNDSEDKNNGDHEEMGIDLPTSSVAPTEEANMYDFSKINCISNIGNRSSKLHPMPLMAMAKFIVYIVSSWIQTSEVVEDEDLNEDYIYAEWNLRKWYTAALDVIVVNFENGLLDYFLLLLKEYLFQEKWKHMEAAILPL